MKKGSVIIFVFFLLGCLKDEKKNMQHLDMVAHKIQRCAFWQREYFWEVTKWKEKNRDSTLFYEKKMDSVVAEYKFLNRHYDALIDLYEK